jgi:hypothetical protein
MDTVPTVHEIEAMRSVVDDIVGDVESFDVERALEMLQALQGMASHLRQAIGAVETHLCDVLESPREFNGKLYEIKNAGKWRPDHDEIKNRVRAASAVNAATGELIDRQTAVETAVDIMYDLFVSPSTMPKTGGLERLGLDKPDVADFERQGKRVSILDVR